MALRDPRPRSVVSPGASNSRLAHHRSTVRWSAPAYDGWGFFGGGAIRVHARAVEFISMTQVALISLMNSETRVQLISRCELHNPAHTSKVRVRNPVPTWGFPSRVWRRIVGSCVA